MRPGKSNLTSGWRSRLRTHHPKVPIHCSSQWNSLVKQIEDLDLLFTRLEDSAPEDSAPLLKSIVKYVFGLSWSKPYLHQRLSTFGFPNSLKDGWEVRQLFKIANYWRFCCNLENHCHSREYRHRFQNLQLHIIKKLPPEAARGFEKRHVHAEVQLIVHYELSNPEVWPYAIGASKEACYLCV
jgi:hypothetical protein